MKLVVWTPSLIQEFAFGMCRISSLLFLPQPFGKVLSSAQLSSGEEFEHLIYSMGWFSFGHVEIYDSKELPVSYKGLFSG